MVDNTIVIERKNSIATLSINRPEKRNALSQIMWLRIEELVAEIEQDSNIRVLIVRGRGRKAFCAGADISELAGNASNESAQRLNNAIIQRTQVRLEELSRPTIAMIEGACYGGGCGLALACDFRFANTESHYAITPVKLGLLYSLRDTRRLFNLVGPALCKEMLFTGRQLDAQEAMTKGLVSRLYPADELLRETENFAHLLARQSLFSQQGIKATIALLEGHNNVDGEILERLFDKSFNGIDCKEGTAAFLEKRSPNFPYK